MSGITEALKEKLDDSKDLDLLARLPQTYIVQMGQRKELTPEEVTLIIGKKGQQIEDAANRKALAASMAQPMPSVMEQKMMQIAQAENPAPQMQPQMMAQAPMPQLPEEVGIAQNPVPPMQLAGGGIIAFSGEDGSYVEGEDEDEEYDALIYSLLQRGRSAPSVGIASGYEDKEGRSGDIVERLRAQIMAKESGGRRYDKEGNLLTSSKGALGEMQVMPYTSRDPGFGIRPARDGSPDELRRVGDEYAAAMYNRYGDPKLAMIAYNMGPGATDKWLASGADPRRLPKETQGYIRGVSLAEGGEIKGYSGPQGSVVETEEVPVSALGEMFSGFGNRASQLFGPMVGGEGGGFKPTSKEDIEFAKNYLEQQKRQREIQKQLAASELDLPFYKAVKPSERASVERKREELMSEARGAKPSPAKPSGETFVDPNITALQKRKDYDKPVSKEAVQNVAAIKKEEALTPEQELYNEIRADMKARKEAIAAGRNMDKWQAGLIAGAKMMQTKSPYLMGGLGEGAEAGAQAFADARKLRAAEEAGIASGQGSLYKNLLISKLKDAQLSDTKSFRETQSNDARIKAAEAAVAQALKLPGNAQQQNLLNAYEMQFNQGKLDKAKLPELERLRAWRANLESGIRNRMGPGGGGYTPTQTQTAALNKYSPT
jgi:hypothetical protein